MKLRLENIGIGYSNKCIKQNISFSCCKNELVCLIGENGIGKSTLLKTILGVLTPISGKVLYGNEDIRKLSSKKRALLCSAVLSEANIECDLTVYEIVSLGRSPYTNWLGILDKESKKKVNKCIEQVGLEKKSNSRFSHLSDGEKQKTLIAKALVQETPLIILDEPTSHLDLPNKLEILSLLKQLAHTQNKIILASIHDVENAIDFADRLVILKDDKVVTGTPEDLILNQTINELFSSLNYDSETGTFIFKSDCPIYKPISVYGSGIRLKWTKHALERLGFSITNDQPNKIFVEEKGGWHVTKNGNTWHTNNIEELLNVLQ